MDRVDELLALERLQVRAALDGFLRLRGLFLRQVRQEAGNAVSYGLAWDDALRAVTLTPAEMYGLGARYGSLEPGKVANIVVWSGDPFELSTRVEAVLIRGQEMPLTSRQTELRERYRRLPPEY